MNTSSQTCLPSRTQHGHSEKPVCTACTHSPFFFCFLFLFLFSLLSDLPSRTQHEQEKEKEKEKKKKKNRKRNLPSHTQHEHTMDSVQQPADCLPPRDVFHHTERRRHMNAPLARGEHVPADCLPHSDEFYHTQ